MATTVLTLFYAVANNNKNTFSPTPFPSQGTGGVDKGTTVQRIVQLPTLITALPVGGSPESLPTSSKSNLQPLLLILLIFGKNVIKP